MYVDMCKPESKGEEGVQSVLSPLLSFTHTHT